MLWLGRLALPLLTCSLWTAGGDENHHSLWEPQLLVLTAAPSSLQDFHPWLPKNSRSISLLSCRNKRAQNMWLKQQEFVSHSSGGWKPKIKVPSGLGSGEASLPGL